MITSVYLSNNNIQAVIGKAGRKGIQIQQLCQLTIPEGSLINGVITNEDELKELLEGFWQQFGLPKKGVSLVISSSQFVIKSMDLPKLSSGKIQGIIPKEFVDVERAHDPLYDYIDITKTAKAQTRDIVGVMAERVFIESYIHLFQQMGIRLVSIAPSYLAELQILGCLPQVTKKACIVLLMDGNNMSTMLWENGRCLYNNRIRLFNEHGTAEFGVEVAQSVNRLLQFRQSQQRERLENKDAAPEEGAAVPILDVFLGGVLEEDHSYCVSGLQALGLKVDYLQRDDTIQMPPEEWNGYFFDFVPAIGNLYPTVDFLKKYKKNKQGDHSAEKIVKRLMPVIVTAGLCVVVSLAVWIPNWIKRGQLNKINEYLENPSHVQAVKQADSLTQENDWLLKRCKEAEYAGAALDSYPILNSKVQEEIKKCTKGKVSIDISSFYAENGALTMETVASKAIDINQFIEDLRKSKLFWNVEYTGFSYIETDKKYNVNVTCYLASQKQEEEKNDDKAD